MSCVTECMLRATSIGVGNVVVDMNTTSFNLMWTTNKAYNSSYFITLSANSEDVMNISTNESFVSIILQINLFYSMDIFYKCNGTRKDLTSLQIVWFRDNTLVQGNFTRSSNQILTVIYATSNNSVNNTTNFPNTPSLGEILKLDVSITYKKFNLCLF